MSNPDNESYQRKNVENKGFSVNLLKKGKLNFKRKNLLFLYNSKTFKQGQARKSVGRMTWHQEPKKDVTSCDKLRGMANTCRSADFRMGKPTQSRDCVVLYE